MVDAIPVLKLNACEYKDIASNTPVWNKSALDYYVYIELPHTVPHRSSLYGVAEVSASGLVCVPQGAIFRDANCWLRGIVPMLNLTSGLHIYKLMFADTITNAVFDLYIGYNIQDDNPDKPYVYMQREENSCNDNSADNTSG